MGFFGIVQQIAFHNLKYRKRSLIVKLPISSLKSSIGEFQLV